jgi:hypothetical protein
MSLNKVVPLNSTTSPSIEIIFVFLKISGGKDKKMKMGWMSK